MKKNFAVVDKFVIPCTKSNFLLLLTDPLNNISFNPFQLNYQLWVIQQKDTVYSK